MALLALLLLMASEVWLLVQVGSATSALLVVAWVVASFAMGLSLMRRGAAKATELSLEAGESVSTVMTPLGLLVTRRDHVGSRVELFDAMGLVFAGFLFVLPGLVSDLFGLLLLIPGLRRHLVARALSLRAPLSPRPGGATGYRQAGAADTAKKAHTTHTTSRPSRSKTSAEVEVLPPGSLPHSPLRKRPVVIDVD